MPVLAADLIHPAGKLPADWFTAPDLEVWIAAGTATAPAEATTAQEDAITTAYAYWRAYEAKALSVLGSPDSVALGDMSRTTSNGRYDRLMAQAALYEAEWNATVEGATEVAATVPVPPLASRSTIMQPTW